MDTPNQSTPTVKDAEIVEGQTPATPTGANVLIELESMIKSNMKGVDNRKSELKKTREMIASVLENDATYKEHEKTAKEAAKIKNATRSELMKLSHNAQLVSKMHELAAEIKEMNDALSDYLREYQRMSGSNEIEDDDGTVREIVYVAKLIKKSSR
jgi:hypothetical protein